MAQMVFGELTVAFPLLVSHAWHGGAWRGRRARRLNDLF